MRQDLPAGTVTFVFTDIEGSTRVLEELGAERYGGLLSQHHRVCRVAWAEHGGVEVDTAGDAFFVAFPTASGALAAARDAQDALGELGLGVRMGVHTGEVSLGETGYVGLEVHRAARIAAAAHGGQVVVSGATVALAGREGLVELGEHRFKDIDEPVAIFQLGEGSFPPLKTLSNTNLPRPASSFVGRGLELGEVLDRFERGARLVTLTGPGGSGKTRLALEAAATLVPEFRAGVFWVGLASLRDPALVVESVAQTLGAKDGLADHIGERELLLLLDNLEQVIDAAPDLSSLLRACRDLRLLVTSRELLRVEGEVEYAVPPLAEPEAVALFCERAQTEASDEIRELCARLDNLPLAVELAAARTRALSPGQILERLSQRLDLLTGGRDADPRQQTLRATIEWSYDLLSDAEQRLFRRLSVFAGGSTLEAAEQVAGADLDTLRSLVEKSLLRFTGERYWMLETIRQYADEGLRQSAEFASLEARHAEHYLRVAEEQTSAGAYVVQTQGFARLAPEQDNLRSAVSAASARGDLAYVARALMALWMVLLARGFAREGIEWARSLLARRTDLSPEDLTRALVAGSELMRHTGDLDAAETLKLELVELARSTDGQWLSGALADLADIALERGDTGSARSYAEESLKLGGGPRALCSLGEVELQESNCDDAVRCFEEAAAGWEGVHDPNHAATLESLGETVRRMGDRVRAAALFRDAAQRFARLGDEASVADCLEGLAAVAFAARNRERAGVLVGAASRMRAEAGRPQFRPERVPPDLSAGARARGHAMSFDDALTYALGSID